MVVLRRRHSLAVLYLTKMVVDAIAAGVLADLTETLTDAAREALEALR